METSLRTQPRERSVETVGKVLVTVGLGLLLLYIVKKAIERHKEEVREQCREGVLTAHCARAVADTGIDIGQRVAPIAAACLPNPLSFPCLSAAGRGLYREWV